RTSPTDGTGVGRGSSHARTRWARRAGISHPRKTSPSVGGASARRLDPRWMGTVAPHAGPFPNRSARPRGWLPVRVLDAAERARRAVLEVVAVGSGRESHSHHLHGYPRCRG